MEHSLCSSVYVGTQRSSFYDCFMAASLSLSVSHWQYHPINISYSWS